MVIIGWVFTLILDWHNKNEVTTKLKAKTKPQNKTTKAKAK